MKFAGRIDDMLGACCFGCCGGHRGLPVGFLLLRYSVLNTAESLSLLYLLLYLDLYALRADANQTYMCLDRYLT